MQRLKQPCYNLVIFAHGHLQVGHILPQLLSGGVDMQRSFWDGLSLPEFQVLHFSQYRGKLVEGGKNGRHTEALYRNEKTSGILKNAV